MEGRGCGQVGQHRSRILRKDGRLVKGSLESGKEYTITYVIDEKGLDDAIGLELVTTYTAQDGKQHVYSVAPFEVVKKEGDLYTFQATHKLENAGSFKVAYRMFPKKRRTASPSGLLLCSLVQSKIR